MDNKDIAKVFEEIATFLELKGENPFKVNAYYNAAKAIEGLSENVKKIYEEGKLESIKGIGKSISEKISELFKTGKIELHENLKQQIPAGLLQMLKIPGLGPKKIKVLYEKLNITTVEELEYACLENRLLSLEGFGARTQEKIKQGILLLSQYKDKHLLDEVYPLAKSLVEFIRKYPKKAQVEIAGSLRRWKELVKDIDIVIGCESSEDLINYSKGFPYLNEIIEEGENVFSFYSNGIRVDFKIVKPDEFATALAHFTGSKEHNILMRKIAKEKGYKINEYGIFKGEDRIEIRTEQEFYDFFNMQYIEPELREGTNEIDIALEHKLPKLVSRDEIKGFLHVHTKWSDGVPSIEEMALEAKKLGYEYIGIADHSKTAQYAGGLNEERLKKQLEEIDRLNKKLKDFRILKGIEIDILKDGSIDMEEDILKELDYVIASVHSNFNLTEEEMTNRILKALSNPFVDIIGHPTGRLLLGREPYKVNLEAIIEKAKELGKVIELNANPHRLDIDWRYLQKYKDERLFIIINPDAHHLIGLQDMIYGVACARKGWLEKHNVLNTLDYKDVKGKIKK